MWRPYACLVVGLDHESVGHHVDRQPGGRPGAQPVVGPADRAPLPALPFEAVHVEDDSPPEEPQQHHRGHVGRVADVDDVVVLGQGVDRREQRVDDGFEVLGARRRETDDAHAEVRLDLARDRCVAPVDGDVVAPRHQAPAELLGERLEAAVVGRHAAGAEDRDAHGGADGTRISPPAAGLPTRQREGGPSSGRVWADTRGTQPAATEPD